MPPARFTRSLVALTLHFLQALILISLFVNALDILNATPHSVQVQKSVAMSGFFLYVFLDLCCIMERNLVLQAADSACELLHLK
jgi:hypothetical protein